MKPLIKLEEITYTPLQGKPYPVWVINGAHKSPYTQGYIHCTGCGKGHQYRWDSDSRWIQFKCPSCNAVSAWLDESGKPMCGKE